MKRPLTQRQRRIIRFVQEYRKEHGYAPTLTEIATACGTSAQVIAGHVDRLALRGYLNRVPGRPRSVTETRAGIRAAH